MDCVWGCGVCVGGGGGAREKEGERGVREKKKSADKVEKVVSSSAREAVSNGQKALGFPCEN